VTTTQPQRLRETPDLLGAFPRLTDKQIQTLSEHGRRRQIETDEVLIQEGKPCDDFFVILRGKVAVIDDFGGEQRIVRVHGRRRFLGEIGLLKGERSFVTTVACEPGEVLAIPVENLPAAIKHDPILGDLILRAYLIRRSLLIGAGAGFRIIGSRYSPDTRRLREFAAAIGFHTGGSTWKRTSKPRPCSIASGSRPPIRRWSSGAASTYCATPATPSSPSSSAYAPPIRHGRLAIWSSSAPARPASPPPSTPPRTA
jgi:CRP-like cAMP-binding protein